jgi:hypothetical protein
MLLGRMDAVVQKGAKYEQIKPVLVSLLNQEYSNPKIKTDILELIDIGEKSLPEEKSLRQALDPVLDEVEVALKNQAMTPEIIGKLRALLTKKFNPDMIKKLHELIAQAEQCMSLQDKPAATH